MSSIAVLLLLGSALAVESVDVVVIGAGMGGLSAGTWLAKGGMKVLVLEQHHQVGGCTSSFRRGEYTFETALHEMAGGGGEGRLARLLRESGTAEKVELLPIPNLYRSMGPGVDITLPASPEGAIEALSARWPQERRGITRFFAMARRLHGQAAELEDLYRRPLMKLLIPFRQPAVLRHHRKTLQPVMERYTRDPGLQMVLSQLWVYLGPPPSRLAALPYFSMMHAYLAEGAWHVRGTSQALSNAYRDRIQELGGAVRTGVRVASIQVEDGRVQGVTTRDGVVIRAPYVVSAVDPFQTFFGLVGEDKTPPAYAKMLRGLELGTSLVGVWLGLDVLPSHWGITDHEVFINTSLDPEINHQAMSEGRYHEGLLAVTFNTNLGDATYAPPGHSVVNLVAYSDIRTWPEDPEAYRIRKTEVGDQLLTLAERVMPGVRDHIKEMEVFTPRTIQRYTLAKDGIPYGSAFTVDQLLKLSNESPVEGLYLGSSWASPGHGVSTAQISGYQAARLILADLPSPPNSRVRDAASPGRVDASAHVDVAARYHEAHGSTPCTSCHHVGSANAACRTCHKGDALRDAMHAGCQPCHQEERKKNAGSKAPVACAECHRIPG